MNSFPIGVLDSGIGGISVALELIKNLPSESFIYVGDSKNCPYGVKEEEEIFLLSKRLIDFLISKGCKLIVVACNTITVSSIDKLRKEYPNVPIIGIVPVIKTAVKHTKSRKIGIFSTMVTANSDYQKNLVDEWGEDCSILNLGSSTLVPLIENLDFEGVDNILEEELKPFKDAKIDTLALGCSHFPLVKERMQKVLPSVLILDSAEAVSHQVKKILDHNSLNSESRIKRYNFYTTGNPKIMEQILSKLTTRAIVEKISI